MFNITLGSIRHPYNTLCAFPAKLLSNYWQSQGTITLLFKMVICRIRGKVRPNHAGFTRKSFSSVSSSACGRDWPTMGEPGICLPSTQRSGGSSAGSLALQEHELCLAAPPVPEETPLDGMEAGHIHNQMKMRCLPKGICLKDYRLCPQRPAKINSE